MCAAQNPAEAPLPPDGDAPLRIVKIRRDYNSWVARETIEDYALRFTPVRFRRWSALRVANTAFGAAAFLVLEAVGATLLVQYGFVNALWAILATGLIIFLAGWPISVYAARYGVDMDLLTRGAGFGYIGSTLTSLIYASFTFIFFALEAAVMAYALELALSIPPRWGYLICALVVIPLVTHGVSAINRLQAWTQPLWLAMLAAPYVAVLVVNPRVFADIAHYGGSGGQGAAFQWPLFGAALTVGVALITQMGEQADYLRFMPERTAQNRRAWWAAVMLGGPGWVVLGVAKMLGGALLAYLVIAHAAVPAARAVDPNQMYLAAYEYVFPGHGLVAVMATALFVVISQLKINVTNAYAGSLAWSNFFSRLAHSHPGRAVWVVFNTLIAFMLMEMDVFQALGEVLGLYSNVAIAWIMAVVADLVINKPLGLSPPGIEFKRAHLYDINPVGVGAMGLASVISVAAYFGVFGPLAQAFSALVAMAVALVGAPLIAWATRSRYYIARHNQEAHAHAQGDRADGAPPSPPPRAGMLRCVICEREYEAPDMAQCPAYGGPICSLCCTLDARCDDLCKPQASLARQWPALLQCVLPRRLWPALHSGLSHFLLLMLLLAPLLAAVLALIYRQELAALGTTAPGNAAAAAALRGGFINAYLILLLIGGIVVWWMALAHTSRKVAQEESLRQSGLLVSEIALHRKTDAALQRAREQAEQANQAKTRYISTISHELRTPLNSILGYAQLLADDASVPPHRRQAVRVIQRGGEHLMSLIEGTLDIARIEAGKLTLEKTPLRFVDTIAEVARMFELQAAEKDLRFVLDMAGRMPEVVRGDAKRLQQVLMNLLGNAIKFTQQGQISLRVRYQGEIATIEVRDTGCGMSASELARVFEPFARAARAATGAAPGAGLGLTIAGMLVALMGGELTASSQIGQGSVFRLKLFLPEAPPETATAGAAALPGGDASAPRRLGYEGRRQRVLTVDNEEADRRLIAQWLEPLGFEVREAANGHEALDMLEAGFQPDVILMDLAMPGIDGWETLRRIRALGGDGPSPSSPPHCAVVSSNAFDRGLPNDAGIAAADYFIKPVRLNDLLAWLQNRLQLTWRTQTSGANAPAAHDPASAAPAAAMRLPPSGEALQTLAQAVSVGYYRGVLKALDALAAQHPECAAFVEHARALAGQFRMDALADLLQQTDNAAAATHPPKEHPP
ncbi:MAG: response regulator [Burkholderiaceae bacterium]|jgi:signal transduction histidine kinase/CheY-like chemotaxis protein/purine-cytosine permease-like protein|nr:response regulator [Burkholderiaceae bacterium]